ncbi:hypothetical protein [Microbacterium sp. T2.11-28]|uniref:hypothetical protein n=1 Tax=unclassified Microbacterium TaxID=2609290 RepID=UPI002477AF87|nr:hypothetical protein [Microbacterium sp. T2.11-28]CAI9393618.1 hypothetical protein MICABA_02507 [Microbacterium sp. T2.11-28]
MTDMVKLDLGEIAGTAGRAQSIRRTFESSDDSSRQAADACGHADLAETVRRFASTWDDRRRGMAEALGTLAGVLSDIHDAFEQVDRDLGSSIGSR